MTAGVGGSGSSLIFDSVLEPTADPSVAATLEQSGFDRAWVTETVRDPYLCLAAAARSTTTLGLGTGVAIAFARSPMTTALAAYDLQRTSGGRFWLGLGSQVSSHIRYRFSMPWSRPADRMREYVQALRSIWASWSDGAALDFRGEFYTHTLMTPFFNPGPNGYPSPPVLLGGVGAQMTAVAGEVADGFISGPLTSTLSLREHALPAIERGLDVRSEALTRPFERVVMPLVVTGTDRADTARVAEATRARLAFYASTPAYRAILELHGWGELHDRLHALSKLGHWDEMAALINDEVLNTFAVVAEPESVAAELQRRFGTHATRAIMHSAADLGIDVWRTVVDGAESAMAATTGPTS